MDPMKQFTVRFELSMTRDKAAALLAAGLLAVSALELHPETLSLTTYYPSPLGVYNQLITTNQTLLARDAGNVGIGYTNPSDKLNVNGQVGIGTTNGPASLTVQNGTISAGDFATSHSDWTLALGDVWPHIYLHDHSAGRATSPPMIKTSGSDFMNFAGDDGGTIYFDFMANAPGSANANYAWVRAFGPGASGAYWSGITADSGRGYLYSNTGRMSIHPWNWFDVGNSEIIFSETNHNHSGRGNTSGWAAIENATDYGALMILGRSTGSGRIVRLWDRLDMTGAGYIRACYWTTYSKAAGSKRCGSAGGVPGGYSNDNNYYAMQPATTGHLYGYTDDDGAWKVDTIPVDGWMLCCRMTD